MDFETLKEMIPFAIFCAVVAWWAKQMVMVLVDALRGDRRYRRLRRRHGRAAPRWEDFEDVMERVPSYDPPAPWGDPPGWWIGIDKD